MTPTLRILGIGDIAVGLAGLAAAGWFAGELGITATAVRVVGLVFVLLGVETLLMQSKPAMGTIAMAVEAIVAVAAIDLVVLGDPTALGTAMLLGTAAYAAAAVARLAILRRTRTLSTA